MDQSQTNSTWAGSGIEFSAVIPTFNRSRLILRALDSVFAQSILPSEIIVVDDGSTDDTRAVLDGYGESISVIYQENAGVAAARHRGILESRFDWIAMLDSDDVWNTDHLLHMKQAIEATDGQANYYFADTRRTRLEGHKLQWEIAGFSTTEPFVLIEDAAELLLQDRQPMMLQATVLNRAAYLACGGFWERLRAREDTHILTKLGIEGSICAVSGVGAMMTDDDESDQRLSFNINRTKRGSEMQIHMNRELLEYFGNNLTKRQQMLLRRRLAHAYLALAQHAWTERDLLSLFNNFEKFIVVDPGFAARKINDKFVDSIRRA